MSPVNILIILLYIAITNQWVFGFWFFYAAIVLIPYMFSDCVGGINRLIITAANFLVGDEIIFFLPVILLLILILLSLYPPFFTNLNLGSLKSFSFFIYFYIFLHYLIIFCYYARSTGINYFLYKTFYISRAFNFNISFGIDNYTIFFLLLTSLLFPFCILINWNYGLVDFKKFLILISLLDISLVCAFLSTNLFFFYFFFEITLIPMYIIINLWGSRTRKVHAGFYFFIYTVFGSIFLLLGILLLYSMFKTTDIRVLSNSYISYERQILLWILFFIGFSTKIPLPPFHLWLPEAHVEAPTSGSVILAGILLKLGSYGMLRFILPVYYYANYFFLPFVYGICCVSIIYISCIAIRQTDLKKIIAYSSIAHMSFVVMGLFSCNLEGLQGSVFLMISHGVVSAALFLCIGILYERKGTRNILYLKNLCNEMPILSFFFFIFILANIGFPLTSGFVGEFIIINSVGIISIPVAIFLSFSTILTAIYSLWLFSRIFFYTVPVLENTVSANKDLNKIEFFICFTLCFFILLLGVFPNFILDKTECLSLFYLNKTHVLLHT